MDTTDQVGTLVKGNSEFALELYAKISRGDGNRFFSPFSISTALAMTYAGAHGETAVQFAKTLRFTLPPEQLHPAFQHLIVEFPRSRLRPECTKACARCPAFYGQCAMDPDRSKNTARFSEAN